MHSKQQLITCFLLPLLLLLTPLHSSHGYEYEAHTHPSTTASHHQQQPHQEKMMMMMDESTLVFFTLDHLKLAHVLPIYFRSNPSSNSPRFLPRHQADSIPFSLSQLPFLLHYFRFSPHSSQATAMESTLRECTAVKPIKGETKFCATSLESMLDFVQQMLGGSFVQPQVLNTQNLDKSGFNVLKNYTIVEEPRQVEAEKMVACHTMPYPYVIYYCHYQTSESKVFQVRLRSSSSSSDEDEEGGIVEAVAVCHMDTSQWSPSHISFQVLGIKPGESPVCHFFPPDNLVWLPLSSSSMITQM